MGAVPLFRRCSLLLSVLRSVSGGRSEILIRLICSVFSSRFYALLDAT
jgi:hypothetical protein